MFKQLSKWGKFRMPFPIVKAPLLAARSAASINSRRSSLEKFEHSPPRMKEHSNVAVHSEQLLRPHLISNIPLRQKLKPPRVRSPVRPVTYRKHTCVRIPLRLKKRWTFKPCHHLDICKQLNQRNPPQLPTDPQKLLSRTLPPLMGLLHNPVPMLGHSQNDDQATDHCQHGLNREGQSTHGRHKQNQCALVPIPVGRVGFPHSSSPACCSSMNPRLSKRSS